MSAADLPIPDEVVEAAARAAHELWRQQASAGDDIAEYPTWDDLENDNARIEYLDQARAALIAGLRAWPDSSYLCDNDSATIRDLECLILPLPPKVEER